ncbi:alpha-glucosidase [Breznakiella homolactica]|uniref:Alpha-glucosidase n=1 Tax=Breznakiella homolactica TaxID=2798577 RepID=A0A7T7XNJ1_9SPIR|nr:alpha-glucosidase [Breznakiella homolactica]QQO09502.1 alpha-glucosidase [Breznakiella homolactica]
MEFAEHQNGFTLSRNGAVLLRHDKNFPMIFIGKGHETMDMYRGNFSIEDYVTERRPLELTDIEKDGAAWVCSFGCEIQARIVLAGDNAEIFFESGNPGINRFWLRVPAEQNETCYGCGEQMSYFNLRGRHFPLWTSEPGVGRDKTTYVTWRSDVENKAGGDYYHTNYPQPTFVSSRRYYLDADCTAYADFDFRNDDFHELQFWAVPARIRIEAADTMVSLLEKLTAFFGRQPELPEWVHDGAILGVQGGTDRAFRLVDRSVRNGILVSGVWCQDWAGKRETSFGRRLQWDWHWNEKMYPGLPEKIREYREKGIRFLVYNNPFLVNDGDLYREAKAKGYFATAEDGGDYLVDFGEFYCGVIDLTNPDAYEWYKQCIIREIIDFGAEGWMADFGEYLPTDMKLHSGISPMLEHNRWPALWAKCNYDAMEAAGTVGKVFFFMRAGATGSQRWCPLLWAGDQSVDFSRHDGLGTTVTAALSAGMSGCGLSHSDIGGYTSLFDNTRTKELFLRWAEMAVFTPVMRTHEGNRPDTNFQFYDDGETMEQFADMTRIHVLLKPYIKDLVAENSRIGLPAQRPLFLHYEDEPDAWTIQTEYLFGRDLLVAPVLEAGREDWRVWLPGDDWVFLWTGGQFGKGSHRVPAKIGRAPVFFRAASPYRDLFLTVKNQYGY